jgi:hypothetical protein
LASHSIWAKCLSRKFATKSSCIALSFAINGYSASFSGKSGPV